MKSRVILIAEDDPSDREAIERALRKANIVNEMRSVHDGAQTIAYLQGEGIYADRTNYPYPELLLLDLRMPRVSGLDVLGWIRAHSQHHELGVIVLTGEEDIRELNRAYALGANSFLTKPLLMEELLNLLTRHQGIRLEPFEEGRHLNFDTGFFRKSPPANPSPPSDKK
jgi:CheY-like chemotaxis protein